MPANEQEGRIVALFQEAADWAQNGDLSGAAFKASEAISEYEATLLSGEEGSG